MSTVASEIKYQVLKSITIQEMVDPDTPLLVDDNVVMASYVMGDILPEGTVLQWGEPALRRMINNEQITPVGLWEAPVSRRGPRSAPATHDEE